MIAAHWVASDTGPEDLELRVGHETIAYVEQEMTRTNHDPNTDTPSGRWEWSAGGTKGVTRQQASAKRRAEEAAGVEEKA